MKFSSASCLSLLALAAAPTDAFVPSVLVGQRAASAFGIPSKAIESSVMPQQRTMLYSTPEGNTETYEFTSDVGRVMDLIINSLYSDRDIFLRELVSNAADACDKKRFLSLTDTEKEAVQPHIHIRADTENNQLIIQDNGVGMTHDELKNNLGKIAQSGTRAFVDALGEGGSKADVNLIGQFGVGFYSSYLVASKVTVVSKSMQDPNKAYKWESTADASYTITEVSPDEIEGDSGTKLMLELKPDAADYLEASKLEELVTRYSEFVEFPVAIWKENTNYKQVPDEEANKDLPEGEEPKMKTVPETIQAYETVNNQRPIWLRAPKEVSEQDYNDFYKSAFKGAFDDPLIHNHFVLEGQVECKSILYIPSVLPMELSRDMFGESHKNIRLYVKRVFINDKFEELIPRWLTFVKGVVDSDDLPLNVSREILQKSKVLSIIRKRLVRKSLDMIRTLSEDADTSKYDTFWKNFGKYIKVGVVEDERNRMELASYLRFYSAKHSGDDDLISLDTYKEKMQEGQKAIYYITGEGKDKTLLSPVVEKLRTKGYDVLLATDPLDEIMLQNLRSYSDIEIVDAANDSLDLNGDDDLEAKKKKEDLNREHVDVTSYLETLLADKVEKVTVSDLLSDSPAVLVKGTYGVSPTMQRYMRVQSVASGNEAAPADFRHKACMEINPNHPIVKGLTQKVTENKDGKDTEDYARLLFDVAALTSGYEIMDMGSFAKRVTTLMSSDSDASTTTDAAPATGASSTAASTDKTEDAEVTPEVEVASDGAGSSESDSGPEATDVEIVE
eukprot:Nitzschia sp. Nitz4//scaffold7_size249615//106032//108481//NITZ4_001170-RA/size249615-augustus-gene-0.8-mRNA-1//1//CDS//3329558421//9191//frame0